jgi:carbon dioxide concentrating mechanism protein CcmN
MLLQPLHSVNYSDFHVSGDVTIHPNVAIASGVLIQADSDSQIIIESGTCIGMGTIIHASKGVIEIKSGVTIGTGVLIIGALTIGANACIGSMTTILNQMIPTAELILAGSLLGVPSANGQVTKVEETQQQSVANTETQECKTTLIIESSSEVQLTESSPDRAETSITIKESIKGTESIPQVYGQENLNRLLAKLLPHRHSLNRPLNNQNNNQNDNSN